MRCKTADADPETGLYCWDCFGYEYGLDAYEYIENNYVIDKNIWDFFQFFKEIFDKCNMRF